MPSATVEIPVVKPSNGLSENSVKTVCEVFKFDKNNFNVYEMKI